MTTSTTATTATSAASMAAAHRGSTGDGGASEQMRAVVQRRYGDCSRLDVERVARPEIADDEVLVEVRAAAIDRGTEHLMTGRPWLIRVLGFGLTRPKQPVLGLDVAGVVREVGAGVTRFAVGDEVFGVANGSLAEFAAAKEEKLAHKPSGVAFEQAAASTVSGVTALQALTDVGRLEAGQHVLVVGASGGVGTFAVQIASALDAVVDGVAGTANLELVASLGARHVFDHRTTDVADIAERYDLIVDIGGRNPVRALRTLLEPDGTVVFVGGEHGNRLTGGVGRQIRAAVLSCFVRHRLAMFMSNPDNTSVERLGELLEAGSIRPEIGARFSLADAVDAMRRMELGLSGGKTVIVVGEEAGRP